MAEATLATPHILAGWKDIAKYLGRGVRSVQRYEQELGLPIRRPATRPRGAVMATTEELDAWLGMKPTRNTHDQTSTSTTRLGTELEQLKARVEEMRRLRAEMASLTVGVGAAARSLSASRALFSGKETVATRCGVSDADSSLGRQCGVQEFEEMDISTKFFVQISPPPST